MRLLAKEQYVVYADDLKGDRESQKSNVDESMVRRKLDKIKRQF